MINVGNVLLSPRFSQTFTVYRQNGSWDSGEWMPGTETPITMTGTIIPASSTDLEQLPEGDWQTGAIAIYTQSQLIVTDASQTSDQILWRGNRWRAMQMSPYADYGYYKTIAVKMDPTAEVTP